jgi:hypothetical protein
MTTLLTVNQTEQPLLDARDMCDAVKRQDALAEFLMTWVFIYFILKNNFPA